MSSDSPVAAPDSVPDAAVFIPSAQSTQPVQPKHTKSVDRPALWLMRVNAGGHPAVYITQAMNAVHARKRLQNAWRDNKIEDCTFPYATSPQEAMSITAADVFGVSIKTTDGFVDKNVRTMEEAIKIAWLERLTTPVWVCGLDG